MAVRRLPLVSQGGLVRQALPLLAPPRPNPSLPSPTLRAYYHSSMLSKRHASSIGHELELCVRKSHANGMLCLMGLYRVRSRLMGQQLRIGGNAKDIIQTCPAREPSLRRSAAHMIRAKLSCHGSVNFFHQEKPSFRLLSKHSLL